MLSTVLRSLFLIVGLIALTSCKSLISSSAEVTPGASQATADSNPAAATRLPKKTKVTKPTPVESTPVEPAVVKKSSIKILDPDDPEQAIARLMQALIQGGIEPLAMADVGYYMDVQNAQLIQLLGSTGFNIRHETDRIILSMPGGDIFERGSDQLNSSAKESLILTADVLSEYAQTQIIVYGHTDDTGEAEYNQKLSVRRALTVAKLLQTQGVAIERFAVVGMGESSPVADNTTEEGLAKNRRIELNLIPIAQ